MPERAGTMPE